MIDNSSFDRAVSCDRGRRRGDSMHVRKRRPRRPIHGWLALDKPTGLTSTQALGRLKRLFSPQKIGHAGTLDPRATGLLPVAFGEATKTVPYLMASRKRYRFTVRWGAATATDDADGVIISESAVRPSRGDIETILTAFTGSISQTPPAFSAVKIDGARAYDIARAGEMPALKARQVEVDTLRIVEMSTPDSTVFETVCGKGTYVRALARDMALRLGTHGHVTALRRCAVGAFDECDMISLEKLEELGHIPVDNSDFTPLLTCLRPIATALDDIPAVAVNRSDAARLRLGQAVVWFGRQPPTDSPICITCADDLVAIGEIEGGVLRARRVFHPAGH